MLECRHIMEILDSIHRSASTVRNGEPASRTQVCVRWCCAKLPVLTAGLLCGWALVLGIRVVYSCQWPNEWDILRDIGTAQTILDGRYPADPILYNHTLWYNPLTGLLLAAAHQWSGTPLPRLAVLLGPFINLLGPLAWLFLGGRLFGRWAALAGLCMIFFAKTPQDPFWVWASYSPWLMAPMYSVGILFFTFAVYIHACRNTQLSGFLWCGLLLGVTFTSHTAPALVAGGTLLLTTAFEILFEERRSDFGGRRKRLALGFFLMLVIAFIASLPYTYSILWNYRFRVLNPWPSLFAADIMMLEHLPARILAALNWRNAIALLGAIASIYRFRRDLTARFLLCWTIVALAFMTQHYLWQGLLKQGIVLAGLVPGHHAAIHLSAVRIALFTAGVLTLTRLLGKGFRHLTRYLGQVRPSANHSSLASEIGPAVVVGVVCLLLYLENPFEKRTDFIPPAPTLYSQFHERRGPVYGWILENTSPDAVFLCEEEWVGLTIVMPAGRKLVSTMALYMNPFVSLASIYDEKRDLLEALKNHDLHAFHEIAEKYPKLYLLRHIKDAANTIPPVPAFFLEQFQSNDFFVYQYTGGAL